jgi:hypothetical protein
MILRSSGYLIMDNADGLISVSNDMTINSLSSSFYESIYKSVLTDGAIEIGGSFKCSRPAGFTASDNHKVVMIPKKRKSGASYKQTISFGTYAERTSRLNKLILRGKKENFVLDNEAESIANEIVYEYSGADELIPI